MLGGSISAALYTLFYPFMDLHFVIAQTLAALVVVLDVIAMQCQRRRQLLLCMSLGALLLAIHFVLLEKMTAALIMFATALRFYISIHTQSKRMGSVFAAVAVGFAVFSYEGLLSVISCAASLFATLGSFSRKDKTLRLMLIAASILWIIHNSLAKTPMAVVADLIFLTSALTGYYRYYIKPAKQTL